MVNSHKERYKRSGVRQEADRAKEEKKSLQATAKGARRTRRGEIPDSGFKPEDVPVDIFLAALDADGDGSVYNAVIRHWVSGGVVPLVTIDPSSYDCSDRFRFDYLLTRILKKYQDFPGDKAERTRKAQKLWEACELQCETTNRALRNKEYLGKKLSPTVTAGDCVEKARQLIKSVLPEIDYNLLDEIVERGGHGPGGTTRLDRRSSHLSKKFVGKPHVSQNCLPLAGILTQRYPEWLPDLDSVEVVMGSKARAVPKDSDIDRLIAKEPDLNIYLQKGIGSIIKDAMRRAAFTSRFKVRTLDLRTQENNRKASRLGSLLGHSATVDLKSASDTVSYELVRLLLPDDWFTLLGWTRCYGGEDIEGRFRGFSKFCSMGNGYCFELESLIFWALTRAVVDLNLLVGDVWVFGDDIVCPSDAISVGLYDLLGLMGLTVNQSKSYHKGPFRESCGKHWFRGVDVTPFYIRKDVDRISRLLLLCNNIRRWQAGWNTRVFRCAKLSACYRELVALLPPCLDHPKIPDGYGDGALIGSFDEVHPVRARRFIEGYIVETTVPIPQNKRLSGPGVLLASLYTLEKCGTDRENTSSGSIRSDEVPRMRARKKILVRSFPDLGIDLERALAELC